MVFSNLKNIFFDSKISKIKMGQSHMSIIITISKSLAAHYIGISNNNIPKNVYLCCIKFLMSDFEQVVLPKEKMFEKTTYMFEKTTNKHTSFKLSLLYIHTNINFIFILCALFSRMSDNCDFCSIYHM